MNSHRLGDVDQVDGEAWSGARFDNLATEHQVAPPLLHRPEIDEHVPVRLRPLGDGRRPSLLGELDQRRAVVRYRGTHLLRVARRDGLDARDGIRKVIVACYEALDNGA